MDKPVDRPIHVTTERHATLAPRYAEVATFMRAPLVLVALLAGIKRLRARRSRRR